MLLMSTVFIVFVLIFLIYVYIRKCFNYWQTLGVPNTLPRTFNVFGDIRRSLFGCTNIAFVHDHIYRRFPHEKFVGIYEFFTPNLLIRDPEFVGNVLAKDFSYFAHRFAEAPPISPLDFHLFLLNDEKWKLVRKKLVPFFSESKLKAMFPMIDHCAATLISVLRNKVQNGESFDAKEIAARFAVDVIGTCMFGLDFNTLQDPESEFRKIGKLMLAPNVRIPLLQLLRFFAPTFLHFFNISDNPPQMLPFFLGLLEQNKVIRRENLIRRCDMMQLLLDIPDEEPLADAHVPKKYYGEVSGAKKIHDRLLFSTVSFNEAVVLSNMFIMYAAGYETTSATISYALLELALHPEIQQRLREEIRTTMADDGHLTYENLKKMNYLEMILKETLRKYSPAPFLNRVCIKPYPLPGSTKILPAGIRITIPVHSIHQNENYYPNPQNFDPERFTLENIKIRPAYTYLPFGEGMRKCIAVRFDKMEIKLCLAQLISNFNFITCKETIFPVITEPRSFLKVPKGGIYLKAEKILENDK